MAASAVLRRGLCLRLLLSSGPTIGPSPLPLLHRLAPQLPCAPASLRFASSRPRVQRSETAPSADEKLKKVLESEITCAQNVTDPADVIDPPEGFPFEILDAPGDQAITLKRTFGNETIEVSVGMNLDSEEETQGADGDDATEDDDKGSNTDDSLQPELSLVATITKEGSSAIEICCNLNQEGLTIENLLMNKQGDSDDGVSYQGPPFSDLDESLQKAMYKYLEARGIDASLFEFLQDYMMNKDDKEYLIWLKNIKEFIEK